MTTRKVQNPNAKGGSGFLWVLLAIIAIAALVIGLIVYNGRAQRSEALAEKMIPVEKLKVDYNEGDAYFTLASTDGGDNAPSASLFEDFSCSHCADLAKKTDGDMLDRIQAGDISVKLHPMTFLDGQGDKYQQGHSTRALAAEIALVAHQDIPAMWNLRAMLFEKQQSVYNKLDNNGLADQARDFGESKEAVQDIRDGKYLPTAEKMGKDNLDYQTEKTGEAYSPRVMRDDKDLIEGGGDLSGWLDELSGK